MSPRYTMFHTTVLILYLVATSERPLTSGQLAVYVGSHEVYIRQMAKKLGGILDFRRGGGGTARLLREPTAITLREVWERTMGHTSLVPLRPCDDPELGGIQAVFSGVAAVLEKRFLNDLGTITIQSLITRTQMRRSASVAAEEGVGARL